MASVSAEYRCGVPAFDNGEDPQLALKVAATYGNPLLVEEVYEFARAYYGGEAGIPGEFRDALDSESRRLAREVDSHRLLRWIDTPTAHEASIHDNVSRLAARYERTRAQVERVASGIGYIGIVCAPAFNEAWEIGRFMHSIRDHHQGEWPIAGIIVPDNNSTDETCHVIRKNKGHDVPAVVQGVGPARQIGIDYGRQRLPKTLPLEQTVFVTSDADCILAPGYVGDHVAAYAKPENSARLIANGPIDYLFEYHGQPEDEDEPELLSVIKANTLPGTNTVHINDAHSYLEITGGKSVAGYFADLGYDLTDFILEDHLHMLGGPNFSFRGSLLNEVPTLYPSHDEWEAHWASISLQTKYPFSAYGMTVRPSHTDGAGVTASARALVGPEGYVSPGKTIMTYERLQELREKGVEPYKVSTGYNVAATSFPRIIQQLHRETYGLYGGRSVDGYYDNYDDAMDAASGCDKHSRHEEPRPALHAGTRAPLGKFVVIGSQH